MKVALFVPCFIDAFHPEVAVATLELLERLGVDVVYPQGQTCCGQPMANGGFERDSAATEALFVRNFQDYEYVVGPSGSCVHHVRHHLTAVPPSPDVAAVRQRTYELVEFLHDVLKVDALPWARFPHKVGLHNACSSLRGLGHASVSERREPVFSKTRALLSLVDGLELVTPRRPDECCGFGGTFSVFNEAVSAKMGYYKVADHRDAGAAYIVSADSSCLMHQQGCARRMDAAIKFIHIAQILNGAAA